MNQVSECGPTFVGLAPPAGFSCHFSCAALQGLLMRDKGPETESLDKIIQNKNLPEAQRDAFKTGFTEGFLKAQALTQRTQGTYLVSVPGGLLGCFTLDRWLPKEKSSFYFFKILCVWKLKFVVVFYCRNGNPLWIINVFKIFWRACH